MTVTRLPLLLVGRAWAAKAALGERVFVLGHHYQRDQVIRFADVTGDSVKRAKDAAARPAAEYVVFCGVHFMAESADILTGDHQEVVLPDSVVPLTYMNSSADIKAFLWTPRGRWKKYAAGSPTCRSSCTSSAPMMS